MTERNLYEVTGDIKDINILLVPRAQLEAMAGEPVADINVRPSESGGTIASVFSHKLPVGSWLLYRAAPVAQQPQARPDFADEWTGYLKDGETPFERFLRERKDVQSALKLYQRALEENERLKAQQPQVEAVPVVDRVYEAAKRLVDHADFQLGGVLSAKSKARDIPSNAASKVKARHLASLRDALAKTPHQAEVAPSDRQIEAACEAVAIALGDAYDCGRHWSAWSYGTMGPDDFSQVSEDDDRVREIALAALGAVGLKVTP